MDKVLIIASLFLLCEKVSPEASRCFEGSECVPLSQCKPKDLNYIVYPCHSGLNLYCCPSEAVQNASLAHLFSRKKDLFPVNCGLIYLGEKITGGTTANIGQFPWMALLGYKQKFVDILEFLCGGTVITEYYILTAAHCLGIGVNHQLVSVRLGEYDLRSDKDCVKANGIEVCGDDPVDIPVENYVVHPAYDAIKLKNDISLVKVKDRIRFSAFIQPICLPFRRNLEIRDLTDQKFTISGWGKTESRKLGGSPVLQYAMVRVWSQSECNNVIPPEVQPISNNQICANGQKEDACKGDSGGPLSNATLDLDGELRNFQVGIVSFASTMTCGVEELPPIYIRVDKYLEWILDMIK